MKRIQQFLQTTFEKEKVVGMSVGITNKDKTLGIFNFGVQNSLTGAPITNDTRFRIASITKVVLGLTVMRLVEQGELSLNVGVGKYVEWLNPTLKDLTLNSLLSHTAGLPSEYTPDGPRDESLLEQSLVNELSKIDISKVGNGSSYLYSNLGIRLVSLIIEKVTGEKFSTTSQKLILTPLGLQQTFFSLEKALTLPLSLPHVVNEGEFTPVAMWENAVRYGAGGLFSTTNDLCKLARFLLNKGVNDGGLTILQPSMIEDMTTPRTSNGKGDFYGLTQMLHSYKDRLLGGHLGSAPPYYANLVTDYKSGYGATILINTQGNEHLRYQIADGVLDILTDK